MMILPDEIILPDQKSPLGGAIVKMVLELACNSACTKRSSNCPKPVQTGSGQCGTDVRNLVQCGSTWPKMAQMIQTGQNWSRPKLICMSLKKNDFSQFLIRFKNQTRLFIPGRVLPQIKAQGRAWPIK